MEHSSGQNAIHVFELHFFLCLLVSSISRCSFSGGHASVPNGRTLVVFLFSAPLIHWGGDNFPFPWIRKEKQKTPHNFCDLWITRSSAQGNCSVKSLVNKIKMKVKKNNNKEKAVTLLLPLGTLVANWPARLLLLCLVQIPYIGETSHGGQSCRGTNPWGDNAVGDKQGTSGPGCLHRTTTRGLP